MFLIHYGWRETSDSEHTTSSLRKFLIHYGWRETRDLRCAARVVAVVSNPLRWEGDLANEIGGR